MAQVRLKQFAQDGATLDQVITWDGSTWVAQDQQGDGPDFEQETLASEVISGTDTALAATLSSVPVSDASVVLRLNGVTQTQGAGADYSVSGQTITWLASTGTAVDMDTDDDIEEWYPISEKQIKWVD